MLVERRAKRASERDSRGSRALPGASEVHHTRRIERRQRNSEKSSGKKKNEIEKGTHSTTAPAHRSLLRTFSMPALHKFLVTPGSRRLVALPPNTALFFPIRCRRLRVLCSMTFWPGFSFSRG